MLLAGTIINSPPETNIRTSREDKKRVETKS